jgi:hypothetical protein
MKLLQKIISGGQTGADRAALDFAIERGIEHGGWCPKGRKAEDGEIAPCYLLQETPTDDYSQRMEWNVRDSDATVIFTIATALFGGSKQTVEFTQSHTKPYLHISERSTGGDGSELLRAFIDNPDIQVLNVAGSRASAEWNVGFFVRRTLGAVCLTHKLPGPNAYGFLPPGTYNVQLETVYDRFATASAQRESLWQGFIRFVDWIKTTNAFRAIEIGGSFLTSKSDPSDIDVALELRPVTEPVQSALWVLNDEHITEIKADYGIQVIVKQFNFELYKGRVPQTFTFASNQLTLFRTLKSCERAMVRNAEKRSPAITEEFKGVVRIDL